MFYMSLFIQYYVVHSILHYITLYYARFSYVRVYKHIHSNTFIRSLFWAIYPLYKCTFHYNQWHYLSLSNYLRIILYVFFLWILLYLLQYLMP